jgi:hypothetical protein
MFRHHYPTLFAAQGLDLLADGAIGRQTYQLFGLNDNTNARQEV